MTNSLTCTNPDCGRTIEYPDGAFQVICPHCNTWHLAPSGGSSVSSGNNFEPENSYQPEPDFVDMFSPEEALPEEIEMEKTVQQEPEEEVVPELGFIITEKGEQFSIKEGKNVLGRKDTDIVIADKTISRRHCVIESIINGDKTIDYVIYDIGHVEGTQSTNGVFISGRSLRLQDYERVPLANGATVRIGNISFQIRYT